MYPSAMLPLKGKALLELTIWLSLFRMELREILLISSWIIKICKKVVKDQNTKRAVLIICYLIYVFTESFMPNIFMNIILLFVADNFFNKNKEIKYEKV